MKIKISDEVDYIPFEVDGVELKKTEILFTNEELRNGVETLSERLGIRGKPGD